MLWSIYVALAVASVAVITAITSTIREIVRKIKQPAELRAVLQKLKVQQPHEHLERGRAFSDIADAEEHERAFHNLRESYYPPGYFPYQRSHRAATSPHRYDTPQVPSGPRDLPRFSKLRRQCEFNVDPKHCLATVSPLNPRSPQQPSNTGQTRE